MLLPPNASNQALKQMATAMLVSDHFGQGQGGSRQARPRKRMISYDNGLQTLSEGAIRV